MTEPTDPRLSDSDLVDCVVDLLLGKVEGCRWYYYQVPLHEPGSPSLIHRFRRDAGGFRWTGDGDPPADQIIPSLFAVMDEHPVIAERAFQRIFDMDEIPNRSGAASGMMGTLNRRDTRYRNRIYERALRSRRCRNALTVVAEGDSWFQFPAIGISHLRWDPVRDIVDHLVERSDLCVQSAAAGGDWLSAMLHTREYIDELSASEPDVFLFSGGGNDMLGNGRLANMVMHRRRRLAALDEIRGNLLALRTASLAPPLFEPARFSNGLAVLANEFFQFMNLLFVQYYLFLRNLRHPARFRHMLVITQGYDFARPRRRSDAPLLSARRAVNAFAGSGGWLWLPLEQKQLDEEEKRDAIYAMVMEFNELLISLVRSKRLGPIAHVDSRGLADDRDWYDEIHLKSHAYRRVAQLYVLAMHEGAKEHGSAAQAFAKVYDTSRLAEAARTWREPLRP